MIFIRFGIVFRIVLFFVFSLTSAAGFASTDFEFVSWFQVQPFGQEMTQVGFDRPVQSQSLPAFGFASDQGDLIARPSTQLTQAGSTVTPCRLAACTSVCGE